MDLNSAERRDALEAYLKGHFGATSVELQNATLLTGGAIQENWSLEVNVVGGANEGTHKLVLRTDAPAALPESHDRLTEFAILKRAHDGNVSVPEPILACDDSRVMGTRFVIMRYVSGSASGRSAVRDPMVQANAQQLGERLGQEIARIQSITEDSELVHLLPRYDAHPAIHLITRYRRWLDDVELNRPALEWVFSWLETHALDVSPLDDRGLVLAHRDFRTGNYMLDQGHLAAILDWEFAGWSHPAEDLGWLCARCWRFGNDGQEAGGVAARADLYAGYEAECGVPVRDEAVRYWEVMAHARWAMIALQQAARHTSGKQRSLELALTANIVPELELGGLLEASNLDSLISSPTTSMVSTGSSEATGFGSQIDAWERGLVDPVDLIQTASMHLKSTLADVIPDSKRYDYLMIANALDVASRLVSQKDETDRDMDPAGAFSNDNAKTDLRNLAGKAEDLAQCFPEILSYARETVAVHNPKRLR